LNQIRERHILRLRWNVKGFNEASPQFGAWTIVMAFHRRNTDRKPHAARNTTRFTPPGQGWIWGRHAVLAALANPMRHHISLHVTRNARAELGETSARLAKEETPTQITTRLPEGAVHQGFALKTRALAPEPLSAVLNPTHGLLVVLDQVTDPHNVGAILRSCAAFGARAVILQNRKSPPFFGALCKTAAGTAETIPHLRVTNIANTLIELKKAGRHVVGLSKEARTGLGTEIATHAGPGLVLVLGAEGSGLRPRTVEHCSAIARIPTGPKAESLNVSNAAAIALYEASRFDPRINPPSQTDPAQQSIKNGRLNQQPNRTGAKCRTQGSGAPPKRSTQAET